MDKMKFETGDMTQKNVEKIAALFPGVVTEAVDVERSTKEKVVLKKAINFGLLKQMLSDDVVDGEECYEFTWVGKKQAIVEANKPIRKTLRPCPQESKNWDTTENLYIEGDNLEVLKLLQESYLGKVKMIYIDPPYNTGSDAFVYNDCFAMNEGDYEELIEYKDEDGKIRFVQNNESNPRFHSDWCSMLYMRLNISKSFLREDGVIFISIDDTELDNTKKIANEVFGEQNFVACLVWKKRATPPNDRSIGRIHEFILCYAYDQEQIKLGLLKRDDQSISRYSNPDLDPMGPWVASDLSANGKGGRLAQTCVYPIVNPTTQKESWPPEGKCWLFNHEKMATYLNEGRIGFREKTGSPYLKRYLSEVRQGLTMPTILTDVGFSLNSAMEIDSIFARKGIFEFAKPTLLLKTLLRVGAPNCNDMVLDFFSGSATTAHAVMQLNAEDGGNRKFIMVQLPEACAEDSEAFKAGYKNICEIGKERIRRAGEKIVAEVERQNEQGSLMDGPKKLPDIGFRVLKLADSNMKDVYFAPSEYHQDQLDMFASNIREDRTDMDLLYGCLLEWGLPLSLPHTREQIEGVTVHTVNNGGDLVDLIACFADEISETVVRAIAAQKPLRAVFRDSSFASSPEKINVAEIFKLLAPDTRVKVI